ncbi:U3 small nucleolar RNA-associated protein 4-like protein [Babesia gibsoni]|uniref:U3 small nucleolar RNA-associated protein 4-like protein n=1 Tax=Babesia gibsoni TaxID=33632 RepID=A0AAD8PFR4_BABGI|nr:U3 small nucleolar RNA-associated protein 4-like protein [Babesia gibsoni]
MSHKLSLVRIYDSQTSSVNAVAFSPCGQYIAAARQPFAVEIYSVETRVHITSLRGSTENTAIRSVIWIPKKEGLLGKKLSGYRIITIGLDAFITDWDLELLLPVRTCCSYGGAIFSAALSYCGSRVFIACDDGRVRSFLLWSSTDKETREPELTFEKVYAGHTKSILSICMLPDDSFFCGTSDSIIFKHDVNSEVPVSKIKVPSPKKPSGPLPKRRKGTQNRIEADSNGVLNSSAADNGVPSSPEDQTDPQIWTLVYLAKHGMLASGDSSGNVILWDIKTCTMHKMFTQHCADVLSMAVGADGDTLFSGGVDTQITVYAYSEKNYIKPNASAGWSANGVKYFHKGDVRCMAVHPNDDRIVSSGSDGILTISNGLKHQNNKRCRTNLILLNIPSWLGTPVVMNRDKTLALCHYHDHCDLWYVPKESQEEDEMPYKLAALRLNKDGGQIVVAQMSPDAKFIAIANQKLLRILTFSMENLELRSEKDNIGDIVVHAMQFLSNTELLVSHLNKGSNTFMLSRLDLTEKKMKTLNHHLREPIIRIDVARSNLEVKLKKLLVTLYSLEGNVYLMDMETEEMHELPMFENAYRVVSTSTSPDFRYLAVFSKGSLFYFYDVERRSIVTYDGDIIHRVPNKICNSHVQVYNALWYNDNNVNRIFIQTSNNVYSIKIEDSLFGVEEKSIRQEPARSNVNFNPRQKIYIGPRKFCDAPCIKKYFYQPPALFNALLKQLNKIRSMDPEDEEEEIASTPVAIGRYLGIKKSKFLVHLELDAGDKGVHLIAFYMPPPQNSIFHRKRYGT